MKPENVSRVEAALVELLRAGYHPEAGGYTIFCFMRQLSDEATCVVSRIDFKQRIGGSILRGQGDPLYYFTNMEPVAASTFVSLANPQYVLNAIRSILNYPNNAPTDKHIAAKAAAAEILSRIDEPL